MISKIATLADFEKYYLLRQDETNIYWTGYQVAPKREKLFDWYKINVESPNRNFFIFFEDSNEKEIVGYLYIDKIIDVPAEVTVSYGVYSKMAGSGYGKKINSFGVDFVKNFLPQISNMGAWIAQDNIASLKCIEKNGYRKTDISKTVEFAGGEIKTFYKYILSL